MAQQIDVPAKHKVVEVHKYNLEDPAAAVHVVERDVPQPQEGEVLCKIFLRPVNPADVFSVQGVYPGFAPEKLPAVPGLDGVAVVARNGPGTQGTFRPGQRVVGIPWGTKQGNGSWQQFVAQPEKALLAVPDGMSDEVASQYFVNPGTAYGFYDTTQVPKGEYLLNNAATSALGRMVISLGKHYGVKTINLVRRRDAAEELMELGADEVLVLGEDDIPKRVDEITEGKKAYAALEPVGGEVTKEVVASVRDHGQVLIYGAMGGFDASVPIPDVLFRDVKIHGFWLSTWLSTKDQAGQKKALHEIMDLLEKGILHAGGGKTFPLDRVGDAINESQKPGRSVKCFLEG